MKQNTKLYLVIVALVGVIFWRECIHAQRQYNATKRFEQLEYEIDDIKADYYNDGFNACLSQF